MDEGDVFGTPVVEAARLCAAAEGRQILAAEVVRLLVKGRGGDEFSPLGELELKGLPEPVTALEVPWERPVSVALPFPELLRTGDALRFTGRTSELELLSGTWKEAQAGERLSVLVAGEPGVGKTRLAAEVARSVHEAGGAVLYGRCQEDLGVPYEPFVEALTFFCEHTPPVDLRSRLGRYPGELVRLLPDLADLVPGLDPPLRSDPETEQYRLFEAVASWLAAAGEAGGLLLVVDDLHWAPAPTLNLLVHVVRAAGPARLLAVGTFRDTEMNPALTAVLADLRRTSTERVALAGLSLEELDELLERLPHQSVAGQLHEETKGNPFFVGEVLRHVAESGVDAVPESVREVIVSRVARLAPATSNLLGVAAVFGRDIDLRPLAVVAGIDPEEAVEALDEALTARLMEEVGVGGYRFVHALVRSALYETLSHNTRAQLHLRAAGAYEHDVARLAHHLVACAPLGEPDRTARACLAAGDRALSVLADAEAEDWCSQGLCFVDDLGLRIDLLTALGEAQRRTGGSASRQTLLDAARLAADHSEVERLVRAVLANSRGFTSVIGQVDEERLEIIQRALDLVGPDPSAERAELLSLQASELVFADDHEARLQAADEARAIAARLDDITVRARVGVRRLYACQVPDRAAAMASEAADLVGLADATADPQLRILSRRPMAPLNVGALAEARRWMREALAIAEESGQPGLRSRAHFDYAGVIDALGDHEEAERLTQVAFDLGQQAAWPDAVQFYGGRMVAHWMFEGQPEIVTALAAQAAAQSPRLVAWRGVWALGLALSGHEEELAGFLTGLRSVAVPVDFLWLSAHYFFAVAHGFGVENPQVATATYEALLPYRSLHAAYGSGYWGPIEVALAITGRVMGDAEGALAHHEAAAATIEDCGAARARALNGYQWPRTLLARDAPGDRQRAVEMAEETLAYCRTKGYATFVTKTDELLATLR
jgi:tetratricopeptide (TPR) repeat protein